MQGLGTPRGVRGRCRSSRPACGPARCGAPDARSAAAECRRVVAGAAAGARAGCATHEAAVGQCRQSLPALPVDAQGRRAAPRPTVIVLDQSRRYAASQRLADGTVVSLAAELKPTQVHPHLERNRARSPAATVAAPPKSSCSALISIISAAAAHAAGNAATDTIFNGADDDASGSVAVLELAEALARGRRPKRTIIFTWFGSEESGGYGASHFLDRPPVPLERIVANLEFEMIGRPDSAVAAAHAVAHRLRADRTSGPRLARQGAKIVQDPHPEQSFFTRSDNIQLARRGVVAQTVSSFGLHDGVSPAVRRSAPGRFPAHDRIDSVDARAGALARELVVQARVAAGEETVVARLSFQLPAES